MQPWNLVFVLLLITNRGAIGAVNEGENAQEFGVLCGLVELAGQTPQILELEDKANVTRLLERFSSFEKLTKQETFGKTATQKEWFDELGLQNVSFDDPRWSKTIQRINEKAQRLAENCLERNRTRETISGKVSKLLKQGVFGINAKTEKEITTGKDIVNTDVFGGPADYEESCGSSKTGDGKTLANDMFCLCVGTEPSSAKAFCGGAVKLKTSDGSWPAIAASAANFVNDWTVIYRECPKLKQKLTAENIRRAIDTFRGLLGKTAGHSGTNKLPEAPYFFGKVGTASQDCTGSSGKTVCVNYKTVMKTDGIEGIKWVKKYLEAAHELDKFNKITEKCEHNLNQLELLYEHASALFIQASREAEKGRMDSKTNNKGSKKHHTSATSSEKVSDPTLISPSRAANSMPIQFILFGSALA